MMEVHETGHYDVLLQGLSDLDFSLYLHGHVHYPANPSEGKPREVACASLGGVPTEGSSGFNIFQWCINGTNKQLKLERYELRQGQYRRADVIDLTHES